MRIKWDWLLTGLLVASAMLTTGLVVRRELMPERAAASSAATNEVVFRENWKDLLAQGITTGPRDAKVHIIEFSDFECPFCEKMHWTLSEVHRRFPAEVAVTFIDYPIEQHRFAELAARASECARTQGRFDAMRDELFRGQREFGLKPWAEFAIAAGVPNGGDFDACMKSTEVLQRVVDGKRIGNELGVAGVPTLMINGWQMMIPASVEELEAMVRRSLDGKKPVT